MVRTLRSRRGGRRELSRRGRPRSGPRLDDLQPLVDQALERRRSPRIAVLVDHRRSVVAASLAERYPSASVLAVPSRLAPWKARGRLAGAGPLDLVVDLASPETDQTRRFCSSFLHLRPDGTYLAPEPPTRQARGPWPLATFVEQLRDGRTTGPRPRLRAALTDAVGEIRRTDCAVAVARRGRTLATLREAEMNQALAVDPSRGRVLDRIDAVTFASRSRFRGSAPLRPGNVRDVIEAPPMYLREYLDAVCAPSSVVVQRGVVAPESFRQNVRKVLKAGAIQAAGPGFARPPVPEKELPALDGAYFFLDNECRGHFGHALTEQVSRLWAWEQVKRAEPHLRLLLGRHPWHPFAEWERVLLEAAGIDRSDIVVIDRPVRVERLVCARQMFSMPHYVHPRIVETWDRIGSALRAQAPDRDYAERIFVARRTPKRPCTNAEEVESLFHRHGFDVVSPEDHPLPEQAEMFHRAQVVGGFAGSGMFTTLFSDSPKHLVMIGSSSYRANNEYLISAVRGHRLDLVTCESSIPQPRKGSSKAAKNSPFSCDMAREGAWLRTVLEDL